MSCIFGKSQEGKSIDAFVNNKNILNCDERGEAGEISKKVFLKAFEIYIHATYYNTEEAFARASVNRSPICPKVKPW